MPISRSVRVTRTAISPRFAMRTFLNGGRAMERWAIVIRDGAKSRAGPHERRTRLPPRRGEGRVGDVTFSSQNSSSFVPVAANASAFRDMFGRRRVTLAAAGGARLAAGIARDEWRPEAAGSAP